MKTVISEPAKGSAITYKELEQMPIGGLVQVIPSNPGAIEVKRIRDTDQGISFKVKMQRGEVWNTDNHEFEEALIVYKGALLDLGSSTEVKRLQGIIISRFESHKVRATVQSIFYVEFVNPTKNDSRRTRKA